MSASLRQIQIANDVEADDAAEIDALGQLRESYDQAKTFIKDYDARLKALASRQAAHASSPEHVRLVPSGKFVLELAKPAATRRISNLPRLIEILTPKLFLTLCKVNTGDIEKYVPEHQLPEVLETVYADTRSAKINPRV